MVELEIVVVLIYLSNLQTSLLEVNDTQADLVGRARRQPSTTDDEQEVVVLLEGHKTTSVSVGLRSSELDPRVLSTKVLVDKDLALTSSADNDATVGTTDRAPDNSRRADGAGALVGNESDVLGSSKVERVGAQAVVDAAAVSAAGLVNEDVLAVGEESNARHTRTSVVVAVSNVVDESGPADEVGGGLVRKLLTMLGVSLVGVVAHELLLVDHHVRLPNRSQAVVRASLATGGNRAGELPGLSAIGASINIDLGLAEVGGDTVSSSQDGALGPLSDSTGKLIQIRLVSQSPTVDGVLDLSNLSPLHTSISGSVDGEVDQRRLG